MQRLTCESCGSNDLRVIERLERSYGDHRLCPQGTRLLVAMASDVRHHEPEPLPPLWCLACDGRARIPTSNSHAFSEAAKASTYCRALVAIPERWRTNPSALIRPR